MTFFTRSLRIRHTHTHNWQEWKTAIRSIYYTDICLFLIHIKFLICFIFLPSSSLHETRRRSLSWKRCWDGDDSLTSWRTPRRGFRFSGACVPAVSVKLVWGRCYHRHTECAPESTSKIYFLLFFELIKSLSAAGLVSKQQWRQIVLTMCCWRRIIYTNQWLG